MSKAIHKVLATVPRTKVIAFSFDTDAADGYAESPSGAVTVTMPTAGTYLCTLPETYEAFYFVGAQLVNNDATSTESARVKTYSATAGTITVQTQTTDGTDAAIAAGTVMVCVIAGRDDS